MCYYKNMAMCVARNERCPISDFIISSQKQKDNYELVGSYDSENIYLLVKRQSMEFNPLVQVSVCDYKSESIENQRYYKLDLLYQNQYKYEEDEFYDQTSFSPNLLYQFDQFMRADEIKDQFSNKWVFKESVIYFKQTNECSEKRNNLFNLNLLFFQNLISFLPLINFLSSLLLQAY
ncbi:transmembrane protein, putative (macronuclear) [Tetrahymena thermophila SB210]|uniref:Transmembrane protein, putative n=1 Tax=Tetrahymena thermophila (strain SB210) TaxID=312017 RepID=Q24I77_TETTS|nr:transmembrane protein, putative [Tetrahymena thermophila SB210]EAS07361.2 transmembrane protein, putative [Tetrahymena thermophila SB210]|eukprot:XP_001027603.2 transmembrane protein, putative [Tetrahymena thermophila SB210]